MTSLVICGSIYGTARAYAERFSAMTGIHAESFENVSSLEGIGTVIYFGSIYAGKITGLKETAGLAGDVKRFVLCTAGLADPDVPAEKERIRRYAEKQMPADLFRRTELFCLPGAIDYSVLSLKHRMMMSALYRVIKMKPASKRTEGDKLIIGSYGGRADMTDLDRLENIAAALSAAD